MLYSDDGKISQYLSTYQNPDKSKREIQSTLQNYRGLCCKLEPYVFNDGSRRELVNLQGTIPVQYKGTSYNIPICIWLMDTHPINAPICYVKPTSDMHIKMSQFVDHNGKIYLPYLHTWSPAHSDLLTLIQVMIITFGEQPPVYSKAKAGSSTTNSNAYPTQPYMPVPPGTSASSSGSSGTPYPPYPPSTSYQPTTSYPGYPPYPTQQYMAPYSGSSSMYYGNYPPYPAASQMPSPPTSNGGTSGPTGTITEDHIKASLMSAVQDKMRRRLREQFSQMQAELETLGRTQQELNQGKNKLDEIINRLEKEESLLDNNIRILEDKNQELEKAIARLADQGPIDVDKAVITTTPLYKQLLNAFAEEAATEDTIYYMGEALRRGVIDLDVFLKQVRTLSRKQFMLRALMQKCRQKAGLAG